jgi:predicted NAD-dependent protein-ADP-ribosyltransferase YbiA (DUF1768 family)
MQAQDLKIYNPSDFPFGPLSNNYQSSLLINGKRWPSVTNYVLSNMMTNPLDRLTLQNAPTQDIPRKTNVEEKVKFVIANIETRQGYSLNADEREKVRLQVIDEVSTQNLDIQGLYDNLLGKEYISTIRTAIEKAYNAKVTEDPNLQTILMETQDKPIIYSSMNTTLGIGADSQGLNLIGKALMQIRHNIKMGSIIKEKEEEKDTMQNKILSGYRATVVLRLELQAGKDLKEYIGKTPLEIIAYYLNLNPDKTLESMNLGDSIGPSIYEMYNRGQLAIVKKELSNPGYMVLAARRDNLRKLKQTLSHRRGELIFQKYTEHKIKEKYPKMSNEDVALAVSQLKDASPSPKSYDALKAKVVDLYLKDKLPNTLTQEIDMELEKLPKIEDSDIKKAERMKDDSSPEEKIGSNTESSTDENPIKQLLSEDNTKAKKAWLISQLQKFTGKSSKKYKKKQIEDLEHELDRYQDRTNPKVPKAAGYWIIKAKTPSNKTILIAKIEGSKPSTKAIAKAISKHNKKSGDNIQTSQTFIVWSSDITPEPIVETEEYQEVKGYTRPQGEPVIIKPIVAENSDSMKEFSPLFKKSFKVDGLSYPNVTTYVTACLITTVGITRDLKDRSVYKRGTTPVEARKILMTQNALSRPDTPVEDAFLDPDSANDIYNGIKNKTFRELLVTFTRIALEKRLEDPVFSQLLYLTGNRPLVWDNRSDIFLGSGTKQNPGANLGGWLLTEIRSQIKQFPAKYGIVKGLPEELANFIVSDHVVSRWMEMRLKDMCNTVTKMQKYLSGAAKQEEAVDAKFVERVLENIYKGCDLDPFKSRSDSIKMPTDFVNMVREFSNMDEKLSKDYNGLIGRIKSEIVAYDDNFYGVKNLSPEEKKSMSPRKFAKLMQLFTERDPTPTEDEIQRYEESLLSDFNQENADQNKSMETFEAAQRLEWDRFILKINTPVKPWGKIYRKMSKLAQRQAAELSASQMDYETRTELIKLQNKQKEKLWDELVQPELSLEIRNEMMIKFQQQQEKDRLEFLGVNTEMKTKEDMAKRYEYLKGGRERLTTLSRQKKEEENHIRLRAVEIAEIYWGKISSMIQLIASSLSDPTQTQVRQVLINSELAVSNDLQCQSTPTNLPDDFSNCIASAIANIISGIRKFNYQYADDLPLSSNDLNLAVDIITGRETEYKQIEDELKDIAESQVDFEAEIDDDFLAEIEEALQVDDDPQVYGEYMDDNVGTEDEGPNAEMGFKSRFGMGQPNADRETMRMILKESSPKSIISDSLIKDFEKSIEDVKSAKMPDRIKRNRVNFFATII